ncbi:MAG: hypothetical protein J6M30_04655 [Bacteroidales bacterium]|nr:hypothetical protein [Bacteroidales bacterium]
MSVLELKARKADLFETIAMIDDENIINTLLKSVKRMLAKQNQQKEEVFLQQSIADVLAQFENGESKRMTASQAKQLLGL